MFGRVPDSKFDSLEQFTGSRVSPGCCRGRIDSMGRKTALPSMLRVELSNPCGGASDLCQPALPRHSAWNARNGCVAHPGWYAPPQLIIGEANIFFPLMSLLIITSTPVGSAALIGTVWFISTWSFFVDTSKREDKPHLRSKTDDEE